MAIDRTTLDQASDMIDYRLLNVLLDWMEKEKINLDHFIENPQGHVNYNPYMIVDFNALNQRSAMLGQVVGLLNEMIQYKQGNTNYTRSQYDFAQDNIPIPLFARLYGWMGKRINDMKAFLSNPSGLAPIPEYNGLFAFDTTKFTNELNMYENSYQGLGIVIQYKQEQYEIAHRGDISGNTISHSSMFGNLT